MYILSIIISILMLIMIMINLEVNLFDEFEKRKRKLGFILLKKKVNFCH